jgi:hypothetical protein
MKTIAMEKDFDFHIDAQTSVSYMSGLTYERVPEAQAEAIVKAGAGHIVKASKAEKAE